MKRNIYDWGGTILAFIVVITVNFLANAIPIGGQTTAEVSAKYPSLFTPAGFTFSIWGVIYFGLILYVAYQAMEGQRANPMLLKINRMFIVNCLANASWILAWQYDHLLVSLMIMAVILLTLILIYRIIYNSESDSRGLKFFVSLPFSLYLGWITVASIANISVLQTAYGWDNIGLAASEWTLLKLSIAGTIGAIMILRFNDIAFALVIAWASFGIASQHVETPVVTGGAKVVMGISLLLATCFIYMKLKSSNAQDQG